MKRRDDTFAWYPSDDPFACSLRATMVREQAAARRFVAGLREGAWATRRWATLETDGNWREPRPRVSLGECEQSFEGLALGKVSPDDQSVKREYKRILGLLQQKRPPYGLRRFNWPDLT